MKKKTLIIKEFLFYLELKMELVHFFYFKEQGTKRIPFYKELANNTGYTS